jgi:hypothetical protein
MTATSEKSTAAPAPAAGPSASLVLAGGDGDERLYPVFDALRRHADGLFLAGPLFLERDEEAELEVHLADGRVRTRVRIVELVRGDQPGMVVALLADDATTARITAAIAA